MEIAEAIEKLENLNLEANETKANIDEIKGKDSILRVESSNYAKTDALRKADDDAAAEANKVKEAENEARRKAHLAIIEELKQKGFEPYTKEELQRDINNVGEAQFFVVKHYNDDPTYIYFLLTKKSRYVEIIKVYHQGTLTEEPEEFVDYRSMGARRQTSMSSIEISIFNATLNNATLKKRSLEALEVKFIFEQGLALKTGFEKPKVKVIEKSTYTKSEISSNANANVRIIDYSEKSIAVVGDTKPIKEDLKRLGGNFNFALTVDGKKQAGWVFSKTKKDAVEKFLLLRRSEGLSGFFFIDKENWEVTYKNIEREYYDSLLEYFKQIIKTHYLGGAGNFYFRNKKDELAYEKLIKKIDIKIPTPYFTNTELMSLTYELLNDTSLHPNLRNKIQEFRNFEVRNINTYGYTREKHKKEVQKALSEGKQVPSEVLAEYPDLNKTEDNMQITEAIAALESLSIIPKEKAKTIQYKGNTYTQIGTNMHQRELYQNLSNKSIDRVYLYKYQNEKWAVGLEGNYADVNDLIVRNLDESVRYEEFITTDEYLKAKSAGIRVSPFQALGKVNTSIIQTIEALQSLSLKKKKALTEYAPIEDYDVEEEKLNHTIEPSDVIVPEGGTETKIDANMDAIFLAKMLKSFNKGADTTEKKILAKFIGWGGLASFFKDERGELPRNAYLTEKAKDIMIANPEYTFGDLMQRLTNMSNFSYLGTAQIRRVAAFSLLSEDEQRGAIVSTINAHYTNRDVVSAMWQFIIDAGYRGGVVLESSAGVGHFIGLMPKKVRQYSKIFAIEKDTLSGEILKLLYPQANVQITGFESATLPLGKIDLSIGNVPFAQKAPYDLHFKDLSKFSMHNYFIAKSIAIAKPGGVVMVITSNYTMDSANTDFRTWAVDGSGGNADFMGAIRLPANAFKKNAGTEVTADIVIYKKRTSEQAHPLAHNNLNLEVIREVDAPKDDKKKASSKTNTVQKDTWTLMVNEYFALNPQMILGEMKFAFEAKTGGLYSQEERVCEAPEGYDLIANLKKAFKLLSDDLGNLFEEVEFEDLLQTTIDNTTTIDENIGQIVVKNGKIYTVERFSLYDSKELVEAKVPMNYGKIDTVELVQDYIELRNTLKELLYLEKTEE